MSENSKQHIMSYLKKGIRYDGRKLDEFRKITVEKNTIKTAEGSAIVHVGRTQVVAGIKMGVQKPYPDRPDEGLLQVGSELYPLASPDFESGPPDKKSIEMARVIDRGIRESKAVDQKKLCITSGEEAWSINIDICAINEEGNLLDAGGIAALAAVMETRFPEYDGSAVDYKKKTDKAIELAKMPIPITVLKIGEYLLVDPTVEEESLLDARLTVTTTEDGKICALQKGGTSALTIDEIKKMVDLAKKTADNIRETVFS